MSNYTYSGVYIEEVPGGPGPISGVSTSNFGLIGSSPKGAIDTVNLFTDFPSVVKAHGDFNSDGLAIHEAYAFFANGGQRLYFVRVASSDAVEAYYDINFTMVTDENVDNTVQPTGIYSLQLDSTPIVTSSVTALTFTNTGTPTEENVFADDGAGNLVFQASPVSGASAGGGSGTIDYTTGEISVTLTTPGDFTGVTDYVTCLYNYRIFRFEMKWPGVAGNFWRVTIEPGSDDYLTSSTASWTRFNVTYEEDLNADATNRNWSVMESYENVVLSDVNDPNYIVSVINDTETGSDNIEVIDYGNSMNLPALQGTQVTAEDFTSSQAHSDASAGVDYDGAWKGWSYQVANDVFGTTFEASFNFIENGLQIGTGATPLSATVDIISPGTTAAPASVTPGSVKIHLILTSASDVTLVDDQTTPGSGVGNIWDGVAGAAGTITYATGQITSAGAVADQLDIDAITAYVADTVVIDSAVLLEDDATSTVGLIYAEPVVIEDDGDGNLSVKANAAAAVAWPPPKFQLNSNGTNEIDYTDGSFTLTWKIDGYPAQGPAGDTTTYATYGVPASTADYYTDPEDSVQGILTSGTDGSAVASTDIVSPSLVADQEGLYAFGQVDELMQLCAADFQTDVTVADAMITYAELMKDKFVLLTVPYGLKPLEATNWKKNTLNKFTSYAALYYPHIKIKDPVSNASLDIPCGGHVAGVYARTDTLANVSTAPAGMSRGSLNWAIGLERELTKEETGVLRSDKINSNVQWANTGRVVWGGLTLDVTGGEWKYIQERRLFMFLEKSVYDATQLYVFENNTPALWSKIRLQVENFLSGLNAQGYFASTNASESYFVICDRSNNPQETVDQGIVFCDVGVAPTTPMEFEVFRFSQKSL